MPEQYDGPAGGLYDPDPTHRSTPDPLVAAAEAELAAAAARLERARAAGAGIPQQPGAAFFPPPQPHEGVVLPAAPPPAAAPEPAPQVTEARAIYGGFTTLNLKSGPKVLRYDFESLLQMEEEYGSIAEMQKVLGSLMAEGVRGPILKRMVQLLHLGLLDYYPIGEAGRRELTRNLELDQLGSYLAEATSAVTRAFGSGGTVAGGGASEEAGPSRGDGSTTSPSSPAASTPPPSGA